MTNLSIIGGGSWGTALAIVLAPRFERVRLWVYEADLAERIRETRENDIYLPGFAVPEAVEIASALDRAMAGAEIVLSAVPSHLVRSIYQKIQPFARRRMVFVSAKKGVENVSLL